MLCYVQELIIWTAQAGGRNFKMHMSKMAFFFFTNITIFEKNMDIAMSTHLLGGIVWKLVC